MSGLIRSMFIAAFVILSLSNLSIFAQTKVEEISNGTIVAEDFAVFKVGETTFFYSDVLILDRQLRLFACSFGSESIFLQTFDWPKFEKEKLHEYKIGTVESLNLLLTPSQNQYIDTLMFVVKLMKYVEDQDVALKKDVMSNFEKVAHLNNCLPSNKSSLGSYTKELVQVEVYLKSRFRQDSFWVAKEDIAKLKSLKPSKNEKQIRLEEKNKKIQDSLKIFYSSLHVQIKHERF